jgi:hypothetical protein
VAYNIRVLYAKHMIGERNVQDYTFLGKNTIPRVIRHRYCTSSDVF